MLARLKTLRDYFSTKIFLMGLGGVIAIYVTLFIYAFAVSGSVREKVEQSLASETVMIENPHGYVHAEVAATSAVDGHTQPEHGDAPKHPEAHHGDVAAHKGKESYPPDHHMPEAIIKPTPVEHSTEHNQGPSTEHDERQDNEAQDDGKSLSDLLSENKTIQRKGLRKAPIDKITEETPQGLVPVKKPHLPSAFEAYKKPFILNKSRHAVAVVVKDFGLSESISSDILKQMPSPVSLILSPYAAHTNTWQKKARRDGHELWMHLPVQTLDFPRRDPGTKGLLSDASLAYNEERLEWALSRTTGYAGMASFTDGALRKSSPMFTAFFNQLFERGLGMLELNTGDGDFVAEIAKAQNAPYAASHLHLKSFALDSAEIKMAESLIKGQQNTIIVVQPSAQNLEQLKVWLLRLQDSGVVIAPASALAAMAVE